MNMFILLPVLFFPFVFYITIFLFDHPENVAFTYLLFFAINAYPIYLIIIAYFNSVLFKKSRILGSVLPTSVLLVLVCGIGYWVFDTSVKMSKNIARENERKKQGYISGTDFLRIIDGNVYYQDTLIVGADAKTFEMVHWPWQRDKNYYYYLGKKIDYIDRNSFEDLDYHYGKDKHHVYYNEKIIEGADTKTFVHIEGTQDGKDANSCYRRGEKVDCAVLQTEE